jgi:hypothetical protein
MPCGAPHSGYKTVTRYDMSGRAPRLLLDISLCFSVTMARMLALVSLALFAGQSVAQVAVWGQCELLGVQVFRMPWLTSVYRRWPGLDG